MPTDWRIETETTIRWDRTGDPATLWTADQAVATKWRRLGYPVHEDGGHWRCAVPIRCISFRAFEKRPPSPAQQAAFAEAAARLAEKRHGASPDVEAADAGTTYEGKPLPGPRPESDHHEPL